ncbi:MAG: hypothetical protein ACYC3O_09090 [Burkholderiales bacterium]
MLTIPTTTNTTSRRIIILLFALGTLFFGLVVGVAATIGFIIPLFMIAGAGVLGILMFVTASAFRWSIAQMVFMLLFVFYFLYFFIQSKFRLPVFTFWEFAVLFTGLWGVSRLSTVISQSKLFILSILAFAGFLLIAIISAFVEGNSRFEAATFQFLSDLKLLLALGFGIYMASRMNIAAIIDRALLPIIIVVMFFLMLQWGAPGVYMSLFNVAQLAKESTDILPSPGVSVFLHPSILAAASAALAIYTFTQWRILGKASGSVLLKFIAFVFLLIASNQRQEIFAFLLVIVAIYVLATNQGMGKRLMASLVILATLIGIFLAVYGQTFITESSSWGIDSVEGATHPRAVLYDAAESLARTYFPLGSGLGTFGGVGSAKYDLSLNYKLGMSQQWWWPEHEEYLLDTYWPNSIAEAGVIGAALLLLHYVLFSIFLFLKAAKASSKELRMAWLIAAASFTWILFNSPTSPAFQEILLLFFPGLFFGIAVVKEREEKMKLVKT